jgi:hypothetical protein
MASGYLRALDITTARLFGLRFARSAAPRDAGTFSFLDGLPERSWKCNRRGRPEAAS